MGASSSSLGDTILFPAPEPSYDETLPGLMWIEEDFPSRPPLDRAASQAIETEVISVRRRKASCFPAFFIPAPHGKARYVLLYWHGNSCDLGHIREELEVLGSFVECHCLALEFPGYGLASSCSAAAATAAAAAVGGAGSSRKVRFSLSDTINRWSRAAFNFLLWLGVHPENVICFGRSIGTGPAAHLAASLKEEGIDVGGVVLHAPYISIHKIVAEYSSLGTWLIEDHWSNARSLSRLAPSTPLLIIHGEDDEIIPAAHGRKLFETYEGEEQVKEGFFPADSSHNAYYVIDDIGKPLQSFLSDKARGESTAPFEVSIPAFVREPPAHAATPAPTSIDPSRMQLGPTKGPGAAAAAAAEAAGIKAHGRGHAEATAAVTALGDTVSSAAVSQATEGSSVREPSSSAAAAAATVKAAAAAEKAAAAPAAARGGNSSSSSPGAFHRLLESGLLDSSVISEIVGGALQETRDLETPRAAQASSSSSKS